MKIKLSKFALRISLIYAVVAAVWILLSGGMLAAFISDSDVRLKLEIYNGWAFVAITALLLYGVLRSQLRHPEQEAAERKQAEEAVHESEAKFRVLTEESLAGVYLIQDGRFRYVNAAEARIMGYTPEELLALPSVLETVADEDRPRVAENFRRRLAGEIKTLHYEFTLVRKDGERRLVEVMGSATTFAGRPAVLGTLQDITERKQAEEALRNSERLLRLVMDLVPHFIFVKDKQSRHLLVNRACAEACKLTPEQMVGRSDLDLAPDSALAESYMKDDQEVIASGRPKFIPEEKLTDAYGQTRFLQTTKIPFPSSAISFPVSGHGEPAIVGVAVDITERKRAEEALRESHAQLTEALQIAHLAYWEYDVASDQFTFNDQFYNVLRTTAKREGGYTMSSAEYAKRFVHPDDRAVVREESQKSLITTDPNFTQQLDHRIIYGDGEVGYFSVHVRVEKDAQGRTVRTHGANLDITERKRAEVAVERLAAIVNSSDDAIIGKTLDGIITSWNQGAERMFGYSAAETVGKPILMLFPPECVNEEKEFLKRIRRGESVKHYESVRVHKDGKRINVSITLSPITDSDGKIIGVSKIARDITEHKQAEEALDRERSLLRTLIDLLPEVLYVKDLNSRFLVANKTLAKEHFGKDDPAQILGKGDMDFFPPAMAAEFRAEEEKVLAGEPLINHEEQVNLADGRRHTVLTTKVPFCDNRGQIQGLVGIGRDITDLKRTEEELRQLNRSLQTLSKCNEALVRTTDEASLLATICQIVTEAGGYRLAWVGYADQDKAKSVRPVAWAGVGEDYVKNLQITWADTERGRGPAGTAIRTGLPSIFSHLAEHPNLAPWRDKVLRHGFAACIGLPLKADDKTFGVLAVYSHRPDAFNAAETALLAELADDLAFGISSLRNRSERNQLEEQLRQSQKMEAIGRLAGGVAHDFNNMLTIIQGNASLLLNPQLDPKEWPACSRQIVQAAERAAGLTRQLLIFSRKQTLQPADVDLNEVVGNMTKMLRRILGEDIVLQTNHAPQPVFIHADIGMIEQVLMNLLVNARDAMPSGGQLSISTDRQDIAEAQVEKNPDALAGPHVCLSVSDTGCGIPKENLPRIFDPFFTTKEAGKGTGLGLATVYSIVQQHRGWITVTSEVNKGTTFKIYFPIVKGEHVAKAPAPQKLLQGSGTILVVEDELAVRTLVSHLLQRCGYTVLQAESGTDALKIWQERQGKIQLLLTDIVMPDGMNGYELARQLQAAKPKLKVVYTSGYSGEIVGKGLELTEGLNFLQKPYVPQKLLQILHDNLNGNEDSSPRGRPSPATKNSQNFS